MATKDVNVMQAADSVPTHDGGMSLPAPAQRALTFGLLLSGLRCTVQYIILPVVLPLVGITATVPPWITAGLSIFALGSLARNVRYLWRIHHPRRRSYLFLALCIGAVLVAFVVADLGGLVRL